MTPGTCMNVRIVKKKLDFAHLFHTFVSDWIFALTVSWKMCYTVSHNEQMKEDITMKHIKTLNTQTLNNTVKKGGCGECQTSCQSACKTSCTVGNQTCEHSK